MQMNLKIGIAKEIVPGKKKDVVSVSIDGELAKAISYPRLTGRVEQGDRLLLNTTAVDLSLGTGGYHFVVANLSKENYEEFEKGGHLMKMRYTPQQIKVLAVEEEDSPYHEIMKRVESLEGCIVAIGELHSMLLPFLAAHSQLVERKPAFLMYGGAALTADISDSLLLAEQWLTGSVTAGEVYGGDLEAMSIYSGLLAARHVFGSETILALPGPGHAGTGTPFGFAGLSALEVIHAVYSLGGRPVYIPRISFADLRQRHRGISHHSLRIMSLALCPLIVPIPELAGEEKIHLEKQIGEIDHQVWIVSRKEIDELKRKTYSLVPEVKTMGRGWKEDQAFFDAILAAVIYIRGEGDKKVFADNT